MGLRKTSLILVLMILGVGVASALTFSGSQEDQVVNETVFDLEYVDSDLNGSLTVYYYENSSLIGSSSDNSSDFSVEFNSTVVDSFQVFNLSAEASNSTVNESRSLLVEVDTDRPNISDVSHERNSDGSIDVSFSVEENGSGIDRIELFRRNDGEEKVDSLKPASDGSFTLVDRNNQSIYGESFDYRLEVRDGAGNSDVYLYNASVSPLDGLGPSLESVSPGNGSFVNNREKKFFRANFSDRLSGLEKLNLSLGTKFKNRTGIGSGTSSIKINISGLDNQETFTAEMWAVDEAGNVEYYSSSFTTDRKAPSFSGEVFPDQQFIQSETTLGIDVSGESNGEVAKVVCFLEGKELETDTRPNNEGVYSCGEVDPSNYLDGEKTLYAEVYDSVGNSRRVEIGSWIFDTSRPEVESVDIIPEYGWKDPEVTLEVRDEASEVDSVEYWFDVYGERESYDDIPDLKSADITFSPSVEGFEDGEHTLNLRVRDQTGKWSNVTEVEYNLLMEARPRPSVEGESIEMSSNGSERFSFKVKNSGRVGMLYTTLNFSGPVTGSEEVGYVPRQSSEEVDIRVDAVNGTGVYNSTLTLRSQSKRKQFKFRTVLRAVEDEKEKLRQRIESLNRSYRSLRENFSSIDKQRIPDQRVREVRQDLEDFENALREAENHMEEDRYYRIAELVPEIEDRKETAEDSVKSLSRFQNQIRILIYALLGAAPILFLSAIYLGRRYDLHPVKGAEERVKPLLARPYRFLKSLVPRESLRGYYREIKYSRLGTKATIKFYRLKRKVKKILRGEGVDWEGYH